MAQGVRTGAHKTVLHNRATGRDREGERAGEGGPEMGRGTRCAAGLRDRRRGPAERTPPL